VLARSDPDAPPDGAHAVLSTATAALALLAAGATSDVAPSFGKTGPAVRIAAVEVDQCLASCPPFPADVTNDWLRSEDGRKVNACPMACRLQQPAAAAFRSACDLATTDGLDLDSARVRSLGRDAPDLVRRLRSALRETEGRRLGPLCAMARATLPSDEKSYLECSGRPQRPEAVDASASGPDPARALRCAVTFAERDLDWISRCPALEAKAEQRECAGREGDGARPRRRAARPKDECEAAAVEALASAFRARRR
jgi:hypothetical protein